MIDPAAIPEDVLGICRRLRDAGHQAHLVGGGVRDMLLDREPKDFDVATSAHPDLVMKLFGSRYALPTGLQHGTVTVLAGSSSPHRHVEVTTFRGEGEYLDGRRPSSVHFSATLEEDLARRDFTMNAIAFDPLRGVLTDPFDGRGDLGRRLVRAVGAATERFREDGLRPLRAVRQATQLGFAIDAPTKSAIPQNLQSFRLVSCERVRDELYKLLGSDDPARGIEMLRETELLGEIMPELLEGVGCAQNRHHRFDVWGHTMATLRAARGDVVLKLGALLHDVGKPRARQPKDDGSGDYTFFRHEHVGAEMAEGIGTRLRLAHAERDSVRLLVANHMFFYTPEWTDGTVRRFAKRVGIAHLPALLALREADVTGRGFDEDRTLETRELRARLDEVATEDAALGVKDLAIDGKDVMRALGIRPSRLVGQILEALLERVLDDPALNTKERLETLARDLAAAEPG